MVIKAVIQQQLIFHYVDIIISVEAKQNEPMRPSIFGWGIFTIAVSQWMAQIVPVLFCYSLLLLYLLLLLPTNDTPLRQQLKCIQPKKKWMRAYTYCTCNWLNVSLFPNITPRFLPSSVGLCSEHELRHLVGAGQQCKHNHYCEGMIWSLKYVADISADNTNVPFLFSSQLRADCERQQNHNQRNHIQEEHAIRWANRTRSHSTCGSIESKRTDSDERWLTRSTRAHYATDARHRRTGRRWDRWCRSIWRPKRDPAPWRRRCQQRGNQIRSKLHANFATAADALIFRSFFFIFIVLYRINMKSSNEHLYFWTVQKQ